MGVNTQLFIDSRWTHSEIISVLERTLNTKVLVKSTHDSNYHRFEFTLNPFENRSLSVFTNYSKAGFTGTLLDLNVWGSSENVMRELAETFGGFLCLQDTTDTYECINGKLDERDGLAFWVRFSIIAGIDHKDPVALKDLMEKTKAKWNRSNTDLDKPKSEF